MQLQPAAVCDAITVVVKTGAGAADVLGVADATLAKEVETLNELLRVL